MVVVYPSQLVRLVGKTWLRVKRSECNERYPFTRAPQPKARLAQARHLSVCNERPHRPTPFLGQYPGAHRATTGHGAAAAARSVYASTPDPSEVY